MSLGSILRERRLKSNLTLKQVAESINATVRHIIYIEGDERKPSLEMLYKLCKLYKMDKLPIT
jgi:transcriptional regulator with XRE-family HTH domain